jgi:protein SERAC1
MFVAKSRASDCHIIDQLSRQALDHSDRVRDTKPHLARIFSATRGIIFLGTPHRGSSVTSLAKVVANIAQVALQTFNDSLIRDLERDSQILDRIRDSFSRVLDRRTLVIWSFVEELPTIGVGKVYILQG